MTGIETAWMMPSIMSGSLMRETPPSALISAGTRSRAMTATAPASSAILACSAVTTSMITPPLSISAMPRLTLAVPVADRAGPVSDGAVVSSEVTVGAFAFRVLDGGYAPLSILRPGPSRPPNRRSGPQPRSSRPYRRLVHRLDRGDHSTPVVRLGGGLAVRAQLRHQTGVGEEVDDSGREGSRVARREQPPRATVLKDRRECRQIAGDDGRAGRHRLDQDDPEALSPDVRRDEDVGGRKQGSAIAIGQRAEEVHTAARGRHRRRSASGASRPADE